jgi:hypothetical protein
VLILAIGAVPPHANRDSAATYREAVTAFAVGVSAMTTQEVPARRS